MQIQLKSDLNKENEYASESSGDYAYDKRN